MNLEERIQASWYWDIKQPILREFLDGEEPWKKVSGITDYVRESARALNALNPKPYGQNIHESAVIGNDVYIGNDVTIEPNVVIDGPAVILDGARLQPTAYLREGVWVGERTRIGTSELYHAIVMDDAFIPHQNYVGNSVVGNKAVMGANSITSATRFDYESEIPIKVKIGDEVYDSETHKLGAMIGDGAFIGCGLILNPGTTIGKGTVLYNMSHAGGHYDSHRMVRPGKDTERIYE
ncbi:MAG: hypothetical protein VW262_06030 [Flavobacteriaceae bacterium]|jgi:NDP-sugar pyrophosphorylase family protein